jgi:pilus assembly protein CpaC
MSQGHQAGDVRYPLAWKATGTARVLRSMPMALPLACLLLAGTALPAAHADDATGAAAMVASAPRIAVRTGTHPGYGRIVFDWPARTEYEAEATAEGLLIRFAEPARLALGAAAPRNVVALSGDGRTVRIDARPGARFRHFHHGPKLVVDVLDPGTDLAEARPPAPAPSAAAVMADLAAATRLRAPARAEADAPRLASATPALPAAPPAVISDAPLAAAPPAPATIRMAQALPPAAQRVGPSMTVPVQGAPFGIPLVPQALAQAPAQAQPQIPGVPQVVAPAPGTTLTRPLVLEQGSGRLVELPSAALTVLVADPRIARVQPASPTSLFIMGVNAGRTNLIATREDGSLVAEFDITVASTVATPGTGLPQAAAGPPPVTAGQIQSMIRRTVRGGQNVRVAMTSRGPITLSGMVPAAIDAQRAEAVAKAMAGEAREVINNLTLLSGIQVNLRVRVAEISREITRELGFNWLGAFNDGTWQVGLRTGGGVVGNLIGALTGAQATGGLVGLGFNSGNFDINGIIDALAQDRLVTILAEPNLTAQSGEVASFLAGGEFPIPVAASNNDNALTVEFKQFGVSLAFVPTVLSPDRLNMRVRPEVSELSEANSVIFPVAGGTVRIPGLSVRRAETTIEVGSGQSFAIAGLLSRNSALNNSGLAGLGEIPVLGALFRSDRFRRNETELVIIITPYLVRPVSDPAALATPLDSFRPSTDLERILLRRQTGSGAPYRQIRPPAAAGFIVE